jgi:hypothetical protein
VLKVCRSCPCSTLLPFSKVSNVDGSQSTIKRQGGKRTSQIWRMNRNCTVLQYDEHSRVTHSEGQLFAVGPPLGIENRSSRALELFLQSTGLQVGAEDRISTALDTRIRRDSPRYAKRSKSRPLSNSKTCHLRARTRAPGSLLDAP